MASVTQVRRLLTLLEKLRSDEAYNARQLAEQLGVSRRTMFRDLRSLEKLGVRADFDEKQQRYTVTMSEELARAAEISPAELQSLIAFGQSETMTNGEGHGGAATLANRFGLPLDLDLGLANAELRTAISQSVSQSQYVELTTVGRDARRVAIIRLARSAGCWYLIVREADSDHISAVPCQDVAQIEVLSDTVDRISSAEIDRLTEQALRQVRSAVDQASIRLNGQAAASMTQDGFSSAYDLEWLDDGRVTVQLPMANVEKTAQWTLGFGEQAEVLSPDSLRKEVTRQVQRLYEQYQ